MPFPWKKVKSKRISQLVNDHLHISQKRRDGSSLVVATGFPTSLIDLFIKNREKLKKPSKKRRQSPPITSPDDDIYDPVIEGPPPPPPPSPAGSPSPQRLPPVLPQPSICANEFFTAARSSSGGKFESVDVEERRGKGEIGRDRDANGVSIGILKIFMVVVLALATKRLTVGITISAVLLLFLECVGKHCGRLSKPCIAAKAAAMPMVRIGARLLRYKKLEKKKQEPSTRPASSPLVQEIQLLESKSYTLPAAAAEIQQEKEITEESLSRERSGYQEIELVEMAMKREESTDCKRKSRKAKIKSKMKKIVPKKFRGAKKEYDLPIAEDEGVIEQYDIVEESENGSISSSVSDYRDEDGNSSICSDRRLSDVIEEADTKIDDNGCKIDFAAARRYMLLCLIVLAGLIGGRPFALVLTLTCLLLLKLGQALPRCINLSFNIKSG